ncbi:transposase [Streptomyces prasinus]|uniref:transposase n=1 Tax=Streptomyces prasinus TaxID=67345 RepID=UPI00340E131F
MDHDRVVRRHELTDQEWELLAPLIPRAATGRPRVDDRQVVNGMVYKIRTGISWRDLPNTPAVDRDLVAGVWWRGGSGQSSTRSSWAAQASATRVLRDGGHL